MNNHKTAIVTGASSGIGSGIAKQLAADGYAVIVNYAGNRDSADAVVREIVVAGGEAKAVQADVTNAEQVATLFSEAEGAFGPIGVIVNNAGVAVRTPLGEFDEADFDRVIATNLKGVFLVLREAARRLPDNGRIINVSASFQGAPIVGYGPYAASKMAIEKMTEVAAKEFGSRNITVNSIRPGPTNTKLFMTGKSPELVKVFADQAALGRIGEPEDIGRVVSFLAGEQGSWVTGQSFGVNGGYW